ncbi:AraC family transcriptional regulator N-terminal domain-containing protein [Paenibacillus sp. sgz500958]|uniref:AraC family transcriptional regulator n=1 Tax=Paenibacillus sp. sgz500958 TaxID=3242475 RepID=UPI0036D27E94
MSIRNELSGSLASVKDGGLLEAETARLASLIYENTPHDGVFNQHILGLNLSRFSRADSDGLKTVHQPSLLLVAQGAKTVMIGHEVYHFGRMDMFMFPVALPVALKTTQASPAEPFLAIRLDLDSQRIAELVLKIYPQGLPVIRQWKAGYVTGADFGMINAAARLVECLQSPGDAELLAPLVMDEILIRLLRSPIGVQVAEMGLTDSGVQRIAKVITWLRDNYAQEMKVADLAELAHMSESSFREHFKSLTSMSPVQYQKALRLHEARRLMLSRQMDATSASQMVGYVSSSQFSREYSRFFGSPPSRDVANLRQQTQMPKTMD